MGETPSPPVAIQHQYVYYYVYYYMFTIMITIILVVMFIIMFVIMFLIMPIMIIEPLFYICLDGRSIQQSLPQPRAAEETDADNEQ
jgi:uncharacterized protein HemY